MRAAYRLFSCLALVSMLSACGSDSGGNRPQIGSGGGSAATGNPDEAITSEVGTCQALCCSDAECGTGKTCTPFDAASGTLGICAGGRDAATSANPAAGPTLSASCFSANTAECNALTDEGCAAGEACDYASGNTDAKPAVSCFGGSNTQAVGESCDNALGPWCQPGLHCVAN